MSPHPACRRLTSRHLGSRYLGSRPGRRWWLRLATAAAVATVVGASVPATALAQPVEPGQWWHDTWRMSEVWGISDGAGVTVAILDGGVDASISELAGAVLSGTNLTGQGQDDGTVDHDPDGHGTGMATLVASRGGSSGMIGAAPAASILPVTADGGGLPEETYSLGIRYAVDHGASVINMSVAALPVGSEPCPARVAAAVRYAISQDVVVVAGSGNEPHGQSRYPGNCPGVVTVGAVDQDLETWEDSHRSEFVDLAAPGVETSSIGPGGAVRYSNGTSVSTALVSGVVALIRDRFPDASAGEVVARLLATAQDLGSPGRDDETGYGLVRPYEALTAEVPAGAPNPVYEGLDLTDVADPGPEDLGYTPPSAPALPAPPTVETGSTSMTPFLVLLAVVGLVLVAVAALVVFLLVRSRRQTPPGPGAFAAPPGPPHAPPPHAPPPGVPAGGQPGESRPGSWVPPPG